MKLANQLFVPQMKKPSNFPERETSSLLENGVFSYFVNPGIPFFLPLGKRVLENMQGVFLDRASDLGMTHMEIPYLMKDRILEKGQEIRETFEEKILRIENEYLRDYHLLTTPEPMVLDLAEDSLFSYRQLPIRLVYNTEIFRGIQRPDDILKGRQFKTFIGTSLDADLDSLQNSLKLFEQLSDAIFNDLGIEVYKRKNKDGVYAEHFYFGEEGDNLDMPEISVEERVRAISLAMTYRYGSHNIEAQFRNSENEKKNVLYGTYGLGTQRAFYALFDSHRDDKGFGLPAELAPSRFYIIPVKKEDLGETEATYRFLGENTILDDREEVIFGKKAEFSDYIGVPWKIIHGNGKYTLKNRDESDRHSFESRERLFEFLDNHEAVS